MNPFVLIGLLELGATKPSRPPVTLPLPPPPAVKPQPKPQPQPPSQVAPERPPNRERPLLSRIRVSAGAGPGFSLDSGNSGLAPGGNPLWFRGAARASLDLMRVGPGDLQVLVPIALQGAGFRMSILGFVIQGSIFGLDVMPSIRYQAEIFPDLSAYGELGLGFGAYQVTFQQQFVGYQSASAGGFGVRLGAGIEYRFLDQVRVFLQPMELTSLAVTSSTTSGGTTVTTSTGTSEWSMVLGVVVPLDPRARP